MFGDDYGVLDANAAPSGFVDTGFNGDHHTGLQSYVGLLRHGWQFVNFESDAVPQAVLECRVTGFRYYFQRLLVQGLAVDTGCDQGKGIEL